MNLLAEILKKILFNPRTGSIAIIFLSGIINKQINKHMGEIETKDPTTTQPLFLPRGSIRAIFAFILLATSIADYVMNSWTLPDEFHAMTIAIVAYYIGYRTDNDQTKEIKF